MFTRREVCKRDACAPVISLPPRDYLYLAQLFSQTLLTPTINGVTVRAILGRQ